LPRKSAGPIEAHARLFNYPPESLLKSSADIPSLGIKAAFISNSFAAYRCSALREVHGFPMNTIVSEDTYVAAMMIEAGWKIKYCADAAVYHSHNYTMTQEFQRYFDLGVFHSREPWIRGRFGHAEGEGRKFVLSKLTFLRKKNKWLIPSALLRTVIKYLGFRLGFCEAYLPIKLKVWLSMQKNYWAK
jgi:rhamnosyltransferase